MYSEKKLKRLEYEEIFQETMDKENKNIQQLKDFQSEI